MTTNNPASVYAACLAAGIPMHSHYSDLYIPATEETRAILKACDCITFRPFRNQVEGGTWYDVPYAYLPYWEAKQAKTPA